MQPTTKTRLDLRPNRDPFEPCTSTCHHKTIRLPFTDLGSFNLDENLSNGHKSAILAASSLVVLYSLKSARYNLRCALSATTFFASASALALKSQNPGLSYPTLRILMHNTGTP